MSSQSNEETASYLAAMFNDDESVCAARTIFDVAVRPVRHALDDSRAVFVSLNPLKHGSSRKSDNVASYRNFLLEFDEGELGEQMAEITSKELPATLITFSGSKSLHAVVCLTEGIPLDEWKQASEYLRVIFPKSDKKVKDPSRLTRVAGRVRDNGASQDAVFQGDRVTPAAFVKWLTKFHKAIGRHENRQAERSAKIQAGEGYVSEWVWKFIETGEKPEFKASRHDALRDAGVALYRSGAASLADIEVLLLQAGELAGVERDLQIEIDGIIKMLERG